VVSFPLAYRAACVAFDAIDPRLEGVARTLGASRLDAFLTVSLPLARRGLVAAALLTFVRAMGEFGATVVLAGNVPGVTRTLPLQIYTLVQVGGPDSDRAVAVLSLVCVAISLVALMSIEALGRRSRT
jgi:molybdate transport system permease protein